MHVAESSSSLFSLWTVLSLPVALHPVSRRRSCLQLRTDQCFCPMRTFTSLLVRTLRRTPRPPVRGSCSYASLRRAQTSTAFPFWKQKLRLEIIFLSKTESKRFSGGERENKGNVPTETVTASQLNNKLLITYYS